MQRRQFIQTGFLSAVASGLVSSGSGATAQPFAGEQIKEEARKIPVADEADVIVCGAGPAGVAAAIEAARSGAKTWLFEVGGALGGVWTSGLLSWVLDNANKGGLMQEIIRKMDAMGGKCDINTGENFAFDVEKMKLLLEDLNTDAGVQIQLHTRVVAVAKDKHNRLTHVITESKSGRQAWKGKIFIDTTGDGDVAALAGCSFHFGNEKGEFQPMSLLALVTGVLFEEINPFVRWQGDTGSKSKKMLLQQIEKGGFHPSYKNPGLYPISNNLYMLMANHEYAVKGIDARQVTKATLQARRELHHIINSLQSTGGIWSNLKLIATADQIGVREGRRINGLYTVSTQDMVEGKRHPDAVATVTFGVDVHSVNHEAEGVNSKKEARKYNMGVKTQDYDIPVRSLIARDVGGLMMAGRCISGDFLSHSSYRVTGNAVAMGEAAGRVAAKAAKQNKLPQEVSYKA